MPPNLHAVDSLKKDGEEISVGAPLSLSDIHIQCQLKRDHKSTRKQLIQQKLC